MNPSRQPHAILTHTSVAVAVRGPDTRHRRRRWGGSREDIHSRGRRDKNIAAGSRVTSHGFIDLIEHIVHAHGYHPTGGTRDLIAETQVHISRHWDRRR